MLIHLSSSGQMGNRMWSTSQVLAYAVENGLPFRSFALGSAGAFFTGSEQIRFPRLNPSVDKLLRIASAVMPTTTLRLGNAWGLRLLRDGTDSLVDPSPSLAKALRCERTYLSGYRFKNLSGLMRRRSLVQEAFSLNETLKDELDDWNEERLGPGPTLGLHVRMGDYRLWREGIYFRDWDWYARFAKEMKERTGAKQLIVTSNEPPPPGFYERLAATPGPGSPILDMYALSRCEWIVGPPSTFSLWSAFISDASIFQFESDQHEDPRRLDLAYLESSVVL